MATNGETYTTLKKSVDFHEMGLRLAWVRKILFLEPLKKFIRSHRLTFGREIQTGETIDGREIQTGETIEAMDK